MTLISLTNRTFFLDCITKQKASMGPPLDGVPIDSFLAAAEELNGLEEASRFLGGHLHWVRSKKPRTLEEALEVAGSNLNYCFEEGLSRSGWVEALAKVRSAETEFKPEPYTISEVRELVKAAKVSEPEVPAKRSDKEGKDPTIAKALAKKVLLKSKRTR